MTHDTPHLDSKRSRQMLDRFRVSQGEGFQLDRYPTDDAAPDIIGKADAKVLLKERYPTPGRPSGAALRQRDLVAADRVPGDGCRR